MAYKLGHILCDIKNYPWLVHLNFLFCSLRRVTKMMCFSFIFPIPFLEKLYKEPAVHAPSLSQLSEIAKGLGLDIEGNELMAYQGGFLRLI